MQRLESPPGTNLYDRNGEGAEAPAQAASAADALGYLSRRRPSHIDRHRRGTRRRRRDQRSRQRVQHPGHQEVDRGAAQMMTQPHLKAQIANELYIAMERLGAGPDLLSIIGSYGDTLDDEEIFALLQEYNATGQALKR